MDSSETVTMNLDPPIRVGNSLVLRDLLISPARASAPCRISFRKDAVERGELVRVLARLGTARTGNLRGDGLAARYGCEGHGVS